MPLSVEFDNLLNSIQDNEDEPLSKIFLISFKIYLDEFFNHFIDLINFTDEEGYGKFLDLNECYIKYVNIKGIEVIIFFFII